MLNQEPHLPSTKQQPTFEKRELLFIALLFLLILCVYSLNLTKSLITPDGAGYPLVAELLLPGWMDGKPAYIWTGRLVFEFWQALATSREALIRTFALYSALFGALTAVNIYLIFRALFNTRYIGGMAAILLAFSPMFFYSAVTIEVYMFNIFWATLAVLFWIKRRFALWGIAWALALSSHITSIFLVFPFFWSVLFNNYRALWRRILVGGCVVILICTVSYGWVLSFYTSLPAYIGFYSSISHDEYIRLPTLGWAIQHLTTFKGFWGFYVLVCGAFFLYFRKQMRKTILILILLPLLIFYVAFYKSNLILLWKSCGYVLTSLSLAAVFLLYKKGHRREQLAFLLAWALPYALFFLGWIQDGGQFYIYIVPQISLIVGALFADMIKEYGVRMSVSRSSLLPTLLRSNSGLTIVVLLFVFALSTGLLQKIGIIRWFHNNPDHHALEITRQIPSGSVLVAAWMGPITKFYAPDLVILNFPFIARPLDTTYSHFLSNIRRYVAAGKKVFVTNHFLFQSTDTKTILARAAIREEFRLLKVHDSIYRIVEKEQSTSCLSRISHG